MPSQSPKLTVAITVREQPQIVKRFVDHHKSLLTNTNLIVIDSGGGEILKHYTIHYTKKYMPLCLARKELIKKIETPYTLILDADTLLPKKYVESAYSFIQSDKANAIAIDYNPPQGHLAFGTSFWKTQTLQHLYDWQCGNPFCECLYMWRRIHQNGYKLVTLPYYATHLKEKRKT